MCGCVACQWWLIAWVCGVSLVVDCIHTRLAIGMSAIKWSLAPQDADYDAEEWFCRAKGWPLNYISTKVHVHSPPGCGHYPYHDEPHSPIINHIMIALIHPLGADRHGVVSRARFAVHHVLRHALRAFGQIRPGNGHINTQSMLVWTRFLG